MTYTLVVLQGLSSKIQHCSGNYSLTEKVTDLKICGEGELIIFILLKAETRFKSQARLQKPEGIKQITSLHLPLLHLVKLWRKTINQLKYSQNYKEHKDQQVYYLICWLSENHGQHQTIYATHF